MMPSRYALIAAFSSFLLSSCAPSLKQAFRATETGEIAVLKRYLGSELKKVNGTDAYGETLLISAVKAKNVPAIRFLLDAGADPDAPLLSGFTPLLYALPKGDSENAMILIEKGTDVMAVNAFDGDKTALHYYAVGGTVECAATLIAMGLDVSALDGINANPLNWASFKGSLEMVKFLVSKGADFRKADRFGDGPLESS
jgi:ankyrin repeat protein